MEQSVAAALRRPHTVHGGFYQAVIVLGFYVWQACPRGLKRHDVVHLLYCSRV
jgi:hypothetical protein